MSLKTMIDNDEKMKNDIAEGSIYLFDPYDGPVFLKIDDIKRWSTSICALYITMKNKKSYLTNGTDVSLAVKKLNKECLQLKE